MLAQKSLVCIWTSFKFKQEILTHVKLLQTLSVSLDCKTNCLLKIQIGIIIYNLYVSQIYVYWNDGKKIVLPIYIMNFHLIFRLHTICHPGLNRSSLSSKIYCVHIWVRPKVLKKYLFISFFNYFYCFRSRKILSN